ncbi:MAG: lysylphosphatidylglycerol synthase domain-containing protein [Ferruginibacter sp.]
MNKNIKLIINYLLGPLLFALLTWSLYKQIIHQPDVEQRWKQIRISWQDYRFWIVFILMFLNWGIEAKKWQLLIAPLEKFSLLRSFKAILAGCSITMLTPNRIGEYGGRIMYVSEPIRLRAISLTILGSISQLSVTMIMGTVALAILQSLHIVTPADNGILSWLLSAPLFYTSVAFTVILLLLYFRVHFLVSVISRIKVPQKLMNHIAVLDIFTGKQLLRILFLSFFRYMVFILQYVLLLKVMDVNISITISFLLLSVFYLVMVVAPTVGFTELPVRATATVMLFGLFSTNILGIQAAAFGIWLINLVLPAIMGSLLIFGIKILKDR